jgi:hypothetical protein
MSEVKPKEKKLLSERITDLEKIPERLDKLEEALKGNGTEKALQLFGEQLSELKESIGKPQPLPPNIRQMFQTSKNEQAELTRKLLTSDEDNYTKTRNPSAFSMMTFHMMGPWISGRYKTVNDMLSPDMKHPEELTGSNLYAIDAIALRGQSRDEYVSVMQPIGLNADMLQFRMNEKAKLKEGNRK